MEAKKELVISLVDDIKHGRLKLPVLPDIALKVRRALEDPNISPDQIAKMISADAALSARLIQVANSPLFRGRVQVDDVRTALLRLGNTAVRTIVSSLLLEQLHSSRSKALKGRMQGLWKHNVRVAALSYALAKRCTKLKPDEAMLAGLIHDIGALPILEGAAAHPELLAEPERLDQIIHDFHTVLGKMILESWKFPPELIEVAAEHENLQRPPSPQPAYVDIVQVADLHSYLGTNHPHAKVKWADLPAFGTLGLTPETSLQTLKDANAEIQEIQRLLSG